MPKQGVKKGSAQAKAYAARLEEEKMLWTVKVLAYTEQAMMDAAALTLEEFFGFGPERQKKFHDCFEAKYSEIRELEKADDDPDMEYSEAVIEEALKQACGKYYVPRAERYDMALRKPSGERVKL